MFARKEKPLPVAVLKPLATNNTQLPAVAGIHLGDGYYWNPEILPNGNIVAIGASGSGKTQTLKAIAYSLHQTYPEMQIVLLDFHGDQEIVSETCYPVSQALITTNSAFKSKSAIFNFDRGVKLEKKGYS
jgi:Cdc6-like AAA superfamily ATPase